MNKWKISFFTLLALVVIVVATLVVMIFSGNTDMAKPTPKSNEGNHIAVTTTPAEFENMANSLITDAMDGSALQAQLAIDEDVKLKSNVTVLGVTVPITLDFDPEIDESGNLLLHQKNVTVGLLDLPAETALKLVRDSGQLPEWLTIQPSEKTAYIDLTSIQMPIGSIGTASMEAKSFDLENKKIVLDIIIPKN
ncbi:MAG: YpmS family protein [Kurthia sp.]|nr:YpmS family protein [Candidatus Kurthia equi]